MYAHRALQLCYILTYDIIISLYTYTGHFYVIVYLHMTLVSHYMLTQGIRHYVLTQAVTNSLYTNTWHYYLVIYFIN